MKYGFVRVKACLPDLKLGDPAWNAQRVIEEIEGSGAEILVFPELTLSGATLGDLYLQQSFTDSCIAALEKIAAATADKRVLAFIGLPVAINGKCYNCAAAVSGGKVLRLIPKTRLNRAERRYFSAECDGAELSFHGEAVSLGAQLLFADGNNAGFSVGCEVGFGEEEELALAGAAIVVCLAADPAQAGKRGEIKTRLSALSLEYACTIVYANAGGYESGSSTVHAGGGLIYENGDLLAEAKPFTGEGAEAETDAEYLYYERRTRGEGSSSLYPVLTGARFLGEKEPSLRAFSPSPFLPEEGKREERSEEILAIQSHALARRLQHTRAKTAVIGVSGGLDSTLALLVTARAFDLLGLPRKRILAYTMPGFGTTDKTKNNSHALMKELGVTAREVPIAQTVRSHFKDISHDEGVRNSAYENAQARYRTMVLLDAANDENGLVVGTGDLSEIALGWCTYNGDHMSNYGVNCSVPKTLVKYLVGYEAQRLGGALQKALEGVIGTEISPELLPPEQNGTIAQKTEDLVGPYELHDFFLYHFLRRGCGPEKLYFLARRTFRGKYDGTTIKKWLKNFYSRFFSQQFKRSCSPDGVKVGPVSLSPHGDWQMPSDAQATAWLETLDRLKE